MSIKKVIYISLAFYLAMVCAVWLIPLSFVACSKDNFLCLAAYWFTESAGKTGTVLIVIATGYFYTVKVGILQEKIKTFFKSIIALGLLLGAFAFVNEHLTKKIIKLPRPSHEYIIENAHDKIVLDSIYSLEESRRGVFFEKLIKSNPEKFEAIDKRVLDHWIEESGFSFPSGHSFNAFMLACVLAFNMHQSRSKTARALYLIPFCWAVFVGISRVAIGAHSPLDVSVGAALGLLVANFFLYLEYTRHFLTRK